MNLIQKNFSWIQIFKKKMDFFFKFFKTHWNYILFKGLAVLNSVFGYEMLKGNT